MSGLVLTDVGITRRGGKPLIAQLSITIAPGAVVTLMGPSGVGKSSLLAYVGGFLDASAFVGEGSVTMDGLMLSALPAERRRLGVLFQDAILFPHLSVAGNLLFGLPNRRRDRRALVQAALVSAGLGGYADRDPATLSGGQRARVALLRTLLAEPRALLLDEPFSKLDAALRAPFRETVFAHARARQLPVLLVTHDPADAAGTVVLLRETA